MPASMVGGSKRLEGVWGRAKRAAGKQYKQGDRRYWGTVNKIFLNIVRKSPSLTAEYKRVHGKSPGERTEETVASMINRIIEGRSVEGVIDEVERAERR